MPEPTRRERLGVTLEMIDAFERQRAATGLTDLEIAARLGLAADQVTFIRVLLEQRRFKPARYYRLFQLGGGRRFRTERDMERDPYNEPQFGSDGLAIRSAL